MLVKMLKYYLETILVKIREFNIETKLNKALKKFYERMELQVLDKK
jgi:hypothetical protein